MTEPIVTLSVQPQHEPASRTILRNGAIALIGGAVLARASGGMTRWPVAALLMLWPSFGGHFVDVGYIRWIGPRLASVSGARVAARILVWFLAGVVLALAMRITAEMIAFWPVTRLRWLAGGLAFVGVELVVHTLLQLRGRPSAFNDRG